MWVRAVVAIFLVIGLGFGTWLSRLPAVRDELGASTLQMSIYGLCLAAGSVVGLLTAGRMVQRFGPRQLLAVTVAAQMVALPGAVALLLAGTTPLGLIALFAYGYSFSTADISMNVSGANAERAEGRSRMPLMHAAYSIGAMLAMGLGAAAEALRIPLELHFVVVLAAIGTVVFSVLRFLPRNELSLRAQGESDQAASRPRPEASAGARGRRYSPWSNPTILLIGLITLSAGLIEGTPADWLPLALVDGRGVSNEFGAVMLGLFFGSVVAARLAGSALLGRFGRVAVLRASFALAAAGVLAVILVPNGVGMVLGTVAWGLGTGVCWPVTISAAADDPETAVLDVAAVSAIGYTSMLLGPMVFGFIGEHIGLLQAFWILPVFALIGFLLAGRARPRTSSHASTHTG